MTNKLTLTEQEELFAKDCKLINLKYEYNGYTGDERWAIITELSVKELWEKYPLVIERYSPFVHLSIAQGEVIDDANRNEDKYAKRSSRTLDCYGYDDEMSSQFHKELAIMFDDPFERAEEERLELERNVQHQGTLNKALRRIIRDCNFEVLDKGQGEDAVILPKFSNHSLRHTFTTRMCEAGVNIKAMQEILGHADAETTMDIYAEATKDLKKSEIINFEDYFTKQMKANSVN